MLRDCSGALRVFVASSLRIESCKSVLTLRNFKTGLSSTSGSLNVSLSFMITVISRSCIVGGSEMGGVSRDKFCCRRSVNMWRVVVENYTDQQKNTSLPEIYKPY
jgi:hypothetical protein